MATSGSFNTSSVGNFYFTFSWSRTGYSSEANKHYIHYELVAHNTPGNYRTVWLKNLYVAGNQVFYESGSSSNGKKYYDGNVVTSGNITVSSSNSSGDGYLSASFEAGVGIYPNSNCSGSDSWDLDRIPRYTQIHASVSSVGLNSIGVKWTTDDNISVIQYRLNSGSWVDVKTGMNTDSGQFTISGLNPNTTYKVDLDAKRRDSGLWSFGAGKGASFSRTTKDIARISSYNSSTNLGDSYAIKYTNPSGAKVQVGIYDTDGRNYYAEYRTVTGSSYTFNFTDTELNSMYAAMGTSNSLSAKLYINTDDNTYRESKNITIKLTGNIKTVWEKISSTWKRGKLWLKVNGVWKRAIMWKNVSGRWKRAK